jgi:hypothetical protein
MATQNLGNVRALIPSTTPPTNTDLLWRDLSISPPKIKEYDSVLASWVDLRADTSLFIPVSEKGVADGVATLDLTGRVPTSQLPLATIELKGSFGSAASTTGGDLPSSGNLQGDTYICDTDGYVSVEAGITFNTSDSAVFDALGNWVKITSSQVQSDWTETDTGAPAYIRNKPFTPTQEERLRELVYEDATATISRDTSIFEAGLLTTTTVNVSWVVTPNDDIVLTVDITNLTGPFPNVGNQNTNITDTTTWTLTVTRTDSESNPKPDLVRNATSTAVIPKFYGVTSNNVYPTTNPYTDLTKLIQSSSSISLQEFSPTNEYVWFITTKGTGIIKDGNGFEQTSDFDITEILLVLPDSSTVTAWTYVSKTTKTLVDFEYELV